MCLFPLRVLAMCSSRNAATIDIVRLCSSGFAVESEPTIVVQYAIASASPIEVGTIDVRPALPSDIAAAASVVENHNGDSVVLASCDESHPLP